MVLTGFQGAANHGLTAPIPYDDAYLVQLRLRECRRGRMCLLDIEVGEVLAAAERRLAAAERHRV